MLEMVLVLQRWMRRHPYRGLEVGRKKKEERQQRGGSQRPLRVQEQGKVQERVREKVQERVREKKR